MPSVRAAPKFNEQNIVTVTMSYDSSIVYDASYYDGANHSAQVGDAVALTGNGIVGHGAAGAALFGKLLEVESDGVCTVAIAGMLQFPAATTNPPLLGHGVTVDGTGKVSSAATAVDAEAGALVVHPSYTADDGSIVAVVALARN
ncbi:MAG TPA: hypothetical protein VE338_02175 [Ktedonobacterales bacterium]|jgi:hypothetical protein|nr:hypothetical protein [Ktedonobacterales bacterium]